MDWFHISEVDSALYAVTGALSNVDIASNQFYPVGPDFMDWNSQPMDSIKNTIGWDWKVYTNTYEILDSNYYFIKNYVGDIYKLWFEWWDGGSTGDFSFYKQFVTTVSVNDIVDEQVSFQIYPNPATNYLTINTPPDLKGNFNLYIVDQTGRQVYTQSIKENELMNGITISSLNIPPGFYLVSITGNNYATSQKLIVR